MVGATGPANRWRLGMIAFAIVVAILLILQLLGGNGGTAVAPGAPAAAMQP